MKDDKRRLGRLQEELENEYSKVSDNYPKYLSKYYQLINYIKSYESIIGIYKSPGKGVSFYIKGKV